MIEQAIRQANAAQLTKPRGGGGLLTGIAATLMLGAAGYFVYSKWEPIMEAIAGPGGSKMIPTTTEPVRTIPTPGVDLVKEGDAQPPAEEASSTALGDSPLPKLDPQPAEPRIVAEPQGKPKQEAAPPKAEPVEDTPSAAAPVTVAKALPEPQPSKASAPETKLVEVGREPVNDAKEMSTSSRTHMEDALTPIRGPKVIGVPDEAREGLHGLVNFLAAGSWGDRVNFSMLPEQVAEKGKAYYASNPDGPIDVDEIHYLRHETNPQVGSGTHCVFVLFSRAWDEGIPVMVEVDANGARVDWLTFVEFKDSMLRQFMGRPQMTGRWRFHVSMRRCHYFDDDVPDADTKDCFEIAPPMPGSPSLYAFTDRASQLARSLAGTITWDKQVTYGIVELEWRQTAGKSWIELTAVPQLNWYSAAAPDVQKAPTMVPTGPLPSSTKPNKSAALRGAR